MNDSTVRHAYERCRRMQRRHDPTFYVATRWLPRDRRPAIHALYGFLRGADEIVDGPSRPADPAQRRAALDAWEWALRDGVAAGHSDHPVLAALVDAGPRHGVPLELASRYLRSMRIDSDGGVRIASRQELDDYMDGSAATVGRLMAPILGVPATQCEHVARLGLAFQLTNFIRDVIEDWSLGRRYLPGVDPEDPRGEQTRRALRAEVARARALFANEREVLRAVPPRARPGIRLACAVYRRTLRTVERRGFAAA